MNELIWLRFAHFTGWMLWIAGLAGMALALKDGARSKTAGILADAGATIAIVSGLYNAIAYGAMKQGWLHVKLLLVVGVIVFHGILRKRTKKGDSRGAGGLLAGCLIVAILVLFAAIIRPIGR